MSVQPTEIEFTDLSEMEEWEIPCEIPSITEASACRGEGVAEWIAYRSIICSCGIIVRLVCTACKVQYQNQMAQHAHFSCPTCREETKGFDRFEPLKQAT